MVPNFYIEKLTEIDAVPCPCGTSKRGFVGVVSAPASVHMVHISKNTKTHYHKNMTEIYIILNGEGVIELDGGLCDVKPMTSIMIKPGCRHRLIGEFDIINFVTPAFDPGDEWFD